MSGKNKLACSKETEKSIADALKDLMQTKSFEKISVSDITDYCGIHRQTFYYHFTDKYELLNFVVHNELIEPLLLNFTLDNMYDKFTFMFNVMKSNQQFYHSALKINASELFNFVSRLAADRFIDLFAEIEKNNNIPAKNETDNKMLAEFFGFGISGVVLEWAQHGMKDSPEMLAERIKNIIDDCKRLAISRL